MIITRTPEGLDKPAVVVGATDEDGHFEVKSLPGTGIGYQASKGCALTLAAGLALATGGAAVIKAIWGLT